jgi:hypothetical protein
MTGVVRTRAPGVAGDSGGWGASLAGGPRASLHRNGPRCRRRRCCAHYHRSRLPRAQVAAPILSCACLESNLAETAGRNADIVPDHGPKVPWTGYIGSAFPSNNAV